MKKLIILTAIFAAVGTLFAQPKPDPRHEPQKVVVVEKAPPPPPAPQKVVVVEKAPPPPPAPQKVVVVEKAPPPPPAPKPRVEPLLNTIIKAVVDDDHHDHHKGEPHRK